MLIIHEKDANDLTQTPVAPRRPPGAVEEDRFAELCLSCGDCVAVCPRRALETDLAGHPVLTNPDTCSKCGLCADVCMHDAIAFTAQTLEGLRYTMAMERLGGM